MGLVEFKFLGELLMKGNLMIKYELKVTITNDTTDEAVVKVFRLGDEGGYYADEQERRVEGVVEETQEAFSKILFNE
jgi:hypothetical protein